MQVNDVARPGAVLHDERHAGGGQRRLLPAVQNNRTAAQFGRQVGAGPDGDLVRAAVVRVLHGLGQPHRVFRIAHGYGGRGRHSQQRAEQGGQAARDFQVSPCVGVDAVPEVVFLQPARRVNVMHPLVARRRQRLDRVSNGIGVGAAEGTQGDDLRLGKLRPEFPDEADVAGRHRLIWFTAALVVLAQIDDDGRGRVREVPGGGRVVV